MCTSAFPLLARLHVVSCPPARLTQLEQHDTFDDYQSVLRRTCPSPKNVALRTRRGKPELKGASFESALLLGVSNWKLPSNLLTEANLNSWGRPPYFDLENRARVAPVYTSVYKSMDLDIWAAGDTGRPSGSRRSLKSS